MPADITIVGLGPGPAELRTVAAQRALDVARHIFVRSHEDVELQDLLQQSNVTDLEPLRNQESHTSADRWLRATQAVIDGAKTQPVVLAIPGHPRFGEGLVKQTLAMAADEGLSTKVIDGISVTDMLASAVDVDPILDRVQLVTARAMQACAEEAPFDGGTLHLTPRLPILVTHAYNSKLMHAVQKQLSRIFPEDHPVEVINSAGLEGEHRTSTTIGQVGENAGGQLVALHIPAMGELDATRDPATLQHIMARLRREDGCPWDRKQTNQSLAGSLADEVYEVIDAINAGDDANFAEELGDLLMLIMMHAQIAEERGAFILEDVYDGITTKIVRRHPHVFGDDAANNADDVVGLWQEIKKQEKAERPDKPEKAEDGQPHSMPALERATRVLKKHPADVEESNADSRQQALFDAVAAIVSAGDDPNQILKQALENHVTGTVSAGESGE